VLFWAFEAGLFDSLAQAPQSAQITQMWDWLKPETISESDSVSEYELMPPAEFAILKDKILAELSTVDQQVSIEHSSPFSPQNSESQVEAESPDQGIERRSEVPRDIRYFLHKIFR